MSYYSKIPCFNYDWPFGADGALLVKSGTTVELPAGSVHDYSSITVELGGVLEISQTTGGWIFLGCAGDMVVNGTIRATNGAHIDGTFPGNAPDENGNPTGELISYTIGQNNGGIGGSGTDGPGATLFGNGGGGGGESAGINASIGKAGDGGIDQEGDAGGLGASVYSQDGGPGSNSDSSHTGLAPNAGGGGGGSRGLHGSGLYVSIKGSVSGSGSITAIGANGGIGGVGGNSMNSAGAAPPFTAGGGGGGGAGGSGGKIVVRYGRSFGGVTLNVSGGVGGSGGAGGLSLSFGGTNGSVGVSGLSGNSGFTDVQQHS